MSQYKALYQNEEAMEIITAKNHDEALKEAWSFETEHGTLFNLFLLNDDYDEIETIL